MDIAKVQQPLMLKNNLYSREAAVTEETFEQNVNKLRSVLEVAPTLVVDVETNGLDSFGTNQICGIGLGEPTLGDLHSTTPLDIMKVIIYPTIT